MLIACPREHGAIIVEAERLSSLMTKQSIQHSTNPLYMVFAVDFNDGCFRFVGARQGSRGIIFERERERKKKR